MIEKLLDYISNKMCNFLLSKDWLKKEKYNDFDYKLRCNLFFMIVFIPLLIIGFILDTYIQVIIITFISNCLRLYTGGVHASNLDQCTKSSILYISIMSVMAKHTIQFSSYLWFMSIFLGIFIIKLIPKNTNEDKNKLRNTYINWFLVFYVLSYLSIQFNYNILSSAISCGILSVGLILTNIGEKIFSYLSSKI